MDERIVKEKERLRFLEEKRIIQYEEPERSFTDKLLGKNKPKKDFKLPRKLTVGANRKIKLNYAITLYLRNNGSCNFFWSPIVDDSIYVKDTKQYHVASGEFVMNMPYKNKLLPFIIIPEWSMIPIYPKEMSAEQKDKYMAYAQKVIIDKAEKAKLEEKKKMNLNIIWIILGILVIGYIILKSLGKV